MSLNHPVITTIKREFKHTQFKPIIIQTLFKPIAIITHEFKHNQFKPIITKFKLIIINQTQFKLPNQIIQIEFQSKWFKLIACLNLQTKG